MSDLEFEKLLEQHNEEYMNAEEFSDWMPEDGEYVAVVSKVSTGVMDKESVKVPWWKLTGDIAEPNNEEIDGKSFSLGFFSAGQLGMLKGLASKLNGSPVDSLPEVNKVLSDSVGKVLRVKVVTTKSKKDGNYYSNSRIQEVIDTTSAPAVEGTEAG